MKVGKLFYIQTVAYIAIENKIRRAYKIDKQDKTCMIRLNYKMIKVNYYL